jgi:ABC-type dipeptide/oligopeptide/nickel transport system permease subunit
VAAALVLLIAVAAAAAPLIVDAVGVTAPNVRDPSAVSALGVASGPSSAHPLGVDEQGRDILARVLYGARTALFVGIVGALIAAMVGGLIGFALGRTPSGLRSRTLVVVDGLVAFPVVLLGLAIGAACSARGCASGAITPGVATVVFAVVVCGLGPPARVVATGASPRRLLGVCAGLVPAAIVLEAVMGFLRVGVQPPTADWGQMISDAGEAIIRGDSAWWYLVFPGVALAITVLAWRTLARRVA